MIRWQQLARLWLECVAWLLAFMCATVAACRGSAHAPAAVQTATTGAAASPHAPREPAIARECGLAKAAGGGDQLKSVVSSCLGHSIDLEIPAVEVGAGARVVQAQYSSGERRLSALAWVISDVEGDRVVALNVMAADNWRPVSLRRERLANESVLVEQAEGQCGSSADGVFMPRLEVAAQATSQLPPPRPDNCASRLERVWVRRGQVFHRVGAYPLRGRQWLGTGRVREFIGSSSFDADRIRVADHVTWYWFTGKSRPAEPNGGFSLELQGESSSESARVFRFAHDSLSDVRAEIEPIPAPGPSRAAWITTDYGVGGVCSRAHQSGRAR